MVVVTGGDESQEFHRQKDEFVRAWTEAGVSATIVDPPGKHHFTVVELLGDPDGAVTREILSKLITTR